MNRQEHAALLYGVAIFRDMDAVQVDAVLDAAGLNLDTCTLNAARDAINAAYVPIPPPPPQHIFIEFVNIAQAHVETGVPVSTLRRWISTLQGAEQKQGRWQVARRTLLASNQYRQWLARKARKAKEQW